MMENRQRQLFYLLPLQKGTWPGARGVCVNGCGRGKEKRMCVCAVGHSGACNYEVYTVIVVAKCVGAS